MIYYIHNKNFKQSKQIKSRSMESDIQIAASFIKNSDYILIGAGAGIGRDSGLPDYRGDQGFWKNYPPYKGLFNFHECANPAFFQKQPNLFWGFYGSRLSLYRNTVPHKGFQMLLNYEKKYGKQIFVVTSNVDGQFQKAGYEQNKLYQIHGTIHYLQCDKCSQITQNKFEPKVDYSLMRSQILPTCEKCNQVTRPNILMFNDYYWISDRSDKQEQNYAKFIKKVRQEKKSVCFIEIGAGTAIHTIRDMLQRNYFQNKGSKYIRINPDKEVNLKINKQRFIHLQLGSLDGLNRIQQCLQKMN